MLLLLFLSGRSRGGTVCGTVTVSARVGGTVSIEAC
ncbi:hypothetical protein VT84_14150 [Gemmata sp. SH-PL17]|nr:hypothetical protein VT84_14150 [Gemmata sp. SH-PL17]